MFAEYITATKALKILNINRITINKYYQIFRRKIYKIENIKKEAMVGEFKGCEFRFNNGAKKTIPCF